LTYRQNHSKSTECWYLLKYGWYVKNEEIRPSLFSIFNASLFSELFWLEPYLPRYRLSIDFKSLLWGKCVGGGYTKEMWRLYYTTPIAVSHQLHFGLKLACDNIKVKYTMVKELFLLVHIKQTERTGSLFNPKKISWRELGMSSTVLFSLALATRTGRGFF
jgi:hypothetical protein